MDDNKSLREREMREGEPDGIFAGFCLVPVGKAKNIQSLPLISHLFSPTKKLPEGSSSALSALFRQHTGIDDLVIFRRERLQTRDGIGQGQKVCRTRSDINPRETKRLGYIAQFIRVPDLKPRLFHRFRSHFVLLMP